MSSLRDSGRRKGATATSGCPSESSWTGSIMSLVWFGQKEQSGLRCWLKKERVWAQCHVQLLHWVCEQNTVTDDRNQGWVKCPPGVFSFFFIGPSRHEDEGSCGSLTTTGHFIIVEQHVVKYLKDQSQIHANKNLNRPRLLGRTYFQLYV